MKRMARVEVSLQALKKGLGLQDSTRVVRIMESMENFSRGTFDVVLEGPGFAEVPEGWVIPYVGMEDLPK